MNARRARSRVPGIRALDLLPAAARAAYLAGALNLAAVWRLPVIFGVENNGWGLSMPTSE